MTASQSLAVDRVRLSTLFSQANSPSWSSATSCNAVVLTLEQYIGSVVNPKQTGTNRGADYSGGALPLEGGKPAGTNPASSSWPYSKRSTSPPCTVTFSNGTALPTLVEIHGLKVGVVTDDECGTVFPNQCDQSFNLCNTNLAPNCASTYPDTMHKLHSEIDMYWNKSGIAPHAPTSGALIDIQGFAFWDDAHLADSWHSFSGWELHPVSAWRLSNGQGLTSSFSYSPSAPTIAQPVTFTANAGGGSPPYSFSWNLGDGSTGTGSPISHSYSSPGSFTVSLTVTDAKGSTSKTSQVVSISGPPDYTVSLNPTSLIVQVGGSGTSTVTLKSINGFAGTIGLGATVSPSGPRASFASTSVVLSAGGTSSSTLTIQVPSTVAAGNYTTIVTSTSGSLSHSATLLLIVKLAPDFSIATSPSSLAAIQGGSTSSIITLTSLNGFSGSVSLSATVSGSGFGVQLSPNNPTVSSGGSSTSTLTIAVPNTAIPDTYLVTLKGQSGSITNTITLPLKVTSFALDVNPGSLTFSPGSRGTFYVSLSSINGFSGNVTLSDKVSNNQLTAALGSQLVYLPATGTVSTTLVVGSSVQGGYTITVTASTGKLSRNLQVTVSVTTQPDFFLSANPIFLAIPQGSSANSTITVTGVNGLLGNVNVQSGVKPSGPIVSLNPTSVQLASGGSALSILTVTVSPSVQAGLYSITVTGSDGPNHPVILTLFITRPVADFSLHVSPNSQTVAAGGSTSYNVSLTSLDGFSGNVTLTDSRQSGFNSSLNPSVVVLTAGSSASSTLTITTTFTTAPATYTFTITAKSGSTIHSIAITLFVTAAPDFTITSNPPSKTMLASDLASTTIALNNANGFAGIVSLASTISPANGLRCALSPSSISGSQTSTLSCGGPTGKYTVMVTGTSGSLTRSTNVTFTVQDFTVSANQTTISLTVGSSVNSTITITSLQGFNSLVGLASYPSSPSIAASLNPVSITGSGTSILTISGGTPGSYTINVTGTSGSLSHSITVNVTVNSAQDFTISASPVSLTVLAGVQGISNVTISSVNGFTGTVNLASSVSGGSALNCTLNPPSVSAGSGKSTLSCSGSAGSYTVIVSGTSGGITHSTTVAFTANPQPDCSISAGSAQLTVTAGGNNSTQLLLQSLNGFSGNITLTAASSPSGPVVSLSQTNLVLASGGSTTSMLTLSTMTSTSTGTYTITVTASSGTLGRNATISLIVSNPSGQSSYSVSITVAGLPSSLNTGLYANGTLTHMAAGGSTVSVSFPSGTSNLIGVDSLVAQSNQTRYVSSQGTVLVTGAASLTFTYGAQNLLTVAGTPSSAASLTPAAGSYWLNASATQGLSAKSAVWTYFFDHWSIDNVTISTSATVQVLMNTPHRAIAYFDGAVPATFNTAGTAQRVFNATDTVIVGAEVSQGTYTVTGIVTTIKAPSGTLLVANATMSPVSGNPGFNYSYNYIVNNGASGQYSYIIYVTFSNKKVMTYANTFNLMMVQTSASIPTAVLPGASYSANFTITVRGSEAHNIVFYLDLPQGMSLTSITLGGQAKPFSSSLSPINGYTRFAVSIGFLTSGGSVQISANVSVAANMLPQQTIIYFHTAWTTYQNYAYSEYLKAQTITIA